LRRTSKGTFENGSNAEFPGSNAKRIQKTHYLVDLKKSTNTDVCLAGWVHEKRTGTDDLSVTLRDSTGLFEIKVKRKSTSPNHELPHYGERALLSPEPR